MGPKHSKFSIAILFIIPLLILASLAVPHFTTIQSGSDVYLKSETITEQDYNENYVLLRYDIEKVPKERMTQSLVAALMKQLAKKYSIRFIQLKLMVRGLAWLLQIKLCKNITALSQLLAK